MAILAAVAQRAQRSTPVGNLVTSAANHALRNGEDWTRLPQILDAQLRTNPRPTLNAVKKELQLIRSYVISAESGQALQVLEKMEADGRLVQIIWLGRHADGNRADDKLIDAGITVGVGPSKLGSFLNEAQSEAARKIAESFVGRTDLEALADLIPEQPPMRVAAILYHLYKMSRDGELPNDRLYELGAQLLGVEVARFTSLALIFAIPGIGPAFAALLVTRALGRMD